VSRDVHVTVTGPGGQMVQQTVAAGQVAAILPQMGNAIPDESVDMSQHAKMAYKVVADLPIVAYQFNPLDNVRVFSNDASLLIPRTAFDVDYYGMSWPVLDRRSQTPSKNNYNGYLTVVAWNDNTQITLTPTAPVSASATMTTLAANTPVNFTLNAFEVLQLEATSGDLTGTHITSPNMMPFGVFGGHERPALVRPRRPTPAIPTARAAPTTSRRCCFRARRGARHSRSRAASSARTSPTTCGSWRRSRALR
jgi:hypothetical protein